MSPAPATGFISGGRARSAACAALAVVLAFGWQFLTVRYNYHGDWTALFSAGAALAPPDAEFHGAYLFPGTGYDGQFYRQIAHDPFFVRGLALLIDAPRLRYRRILVPGLAYAAALGRPDRIDRAYLAVILGFLFLGVYWMARWCAAHGRSPAWGLALVAVPAVPISLDRMTVDLALAALCCGWALYGAERTLTWRSCAVLVALPLARETGALFTLASAVGETDHPWPRRVLAAAATLIPWAAWNVYLSFHTAPDPTVWFGRLPLAGFLTAVWNGPIEPAGLPLRPLLMALDYAALAGIAVAIALAVRYWLAARRGAFEIALLLFALLAIETGNPDVWIHLFAYGRVLSPLLLLLGLRALARRDALAAVPMLLTLPRLLAQFAPQAIGIARGLG